MCLCLCVFIWVICIWLCIPLIYSFSFKSFIYEPVMSNKKLKFDQGNVKHKAVVILIFT